MQNKWCDENAKFTVLSGGQLQILLRGSLRRKPALVTLFSIRFDFAPRAVKSARTEYLIEMQLDRAVVSLLVRHLSIRGHVRYMDDLNAEAIEHERG